MSWGDLHLDAKTAIARTSIGTWNAIMRADPVFGRYALTAVGRSAFLTAFTIVSNGTWYVAGKPHRIGGPARTYPNGTKAWYERGRRHRIGWPAAIYVGGEEEWYENGKLHRIGGPAVMCAGDEMWYENGKLHRIGGPAVVRADGRDEWWEHGEPCQYRAPR